MHGASGPKDNDFSFGQLERDFQLALEIGYDIITCEEYAYKKDALGELTLVNRVDIDFSMGRARLLGELFNRHGIKATFFVRLHANEYNPFSFENYRILKEIRDAGHEIGYHSEIVDQATIWGEDPTDCLLRDIRVLEQMLDIKIRGVASHGGITGQNNLDFWERNCAKDLGLMYEAYDNEDQFGLFYNSTYISDSQWFKWKSYCNGELCVGDELSLSDHLKRSSPIVYLLTHPDCHFIQHIYE